MAVCLGVLTQPRSPGWKARQTVHDMKEPTMTLSLTRRGFLRRAGYAVGSAAFASAIDQLSLVHALAQPPSYKALVCIFLNGGNDCNNTIVPLGDSTDPTGGYPAYQSARKSASLALAQNTLLPLSPNPPSCGGGSFGLHPNLTELQQLSAQGSAGRGGQRRTARRPAYPEPVPIRREANSVPALLPCRPAAAMAKLPLRRSDRYRMGRTHRRPDE